MGNNLDHIFAQLTDESRSVLARNERQQKQAPRMASRNGQNEVKLWKKRSHDFSTIACLFSFFHFQGC
jgi:hypothetical protein